MVKILFVVESFLPETLTGGAVGANAIMTELAKENEVFLLTSSSLKVLELFDKAREKVFRVPKCIRKSILRRVLFFIWLLVEGCAFARKNKIQVINVNVSPFTAVPAVWIAKASNAKLSAAFHGIASRNYFISYYGKYLGWLAIQLQKLMCISVRADIFIVTSKKIKEMLTGYGIAPDKISVACNGVSTDKFKPSSNIVGNSIAFIGVLEPVKGIEFLLNAMPSVLEKIPDCKLKIIGDGSLRQSLEKLCRKLKIERNIEFLGEISTDKMPEEMHKYKAIILPSLSENLPLVMLEALASGKIFIGTRVGGVPEIIRHKENGLLVKSKDSNELAEAIVSVLSDKILSRDIKINARATAEKFSWKKTAECYQRIITYL